MEIRSGFDEKDRSKASALYWQAFGAKLGVVLGPSPRAMDFFGAVLDPNFAICAYDGDELLGLAGYKTSNGALIGGTLRDIVKHYGVFGAIWRVPLLTMLERKSPEHELCMDGICVSAEARGQGVGTALLSAIISQARNLNKTQVRLDVINTNPRARALYEREGFQAVGAAERLGLLRGVFGFESAQQMIYRLEN